MPTLAHSPNRNSLRLTYIGFDGAEFDLLDEAGDVLRAVRVTVASGTSWGRAVRFPDGLSGEATLSTGDDQLDQRIRDRAAEELVRLDAAASAVRAAA